MKTETLTPTVANSATVHRIGLFRDPDYAPCSFLIIKIDEEGFPLPYKGENERNSVLVQSDYDYPSIASTFGWEGNQDDAGAITTASEWLHENAARADYAWQADVTAEDPGYFTN